jgi:hypothetical protein
MVSIPSASRAAFHRMPFQVSSRLALQLLHGRKLFVEDPASAGLPGAHSHSDMESIYSDHRRLPFFDTISLNLGRRQLKIGGEYRRALLDIFYETGTRRAAGRICGSLGISDIVRRRITRATSASRAMMSENVR